MDVLHFVLDYHTHGISCVPFAPGLKKPEPGFSWQQYERTPQTLREVEALFRRKDDANIAILGGEPSDCLVIFDPDDPQSFAELGRRLDGLGIDTWIMQRDHFTEDDPHAGGGQYYLRTPVPVKGCTIDGLQIRGQGQIVIAPPSLHPTGATYQFIHKPATIFRLPSLNAIEGLALEPASEKDGGRKMSRRAWRLLEGDSDTIAKYYSRSEAECGLCASLIRAGYGFDEVFALMHTYPGPGKFRELYTADSKNGMRYLRLTYDKAFAYVQAHPSGTRELAHELLIWAASRPWPGQTGATDKAVFIAHLRIMIQCGKDPHGASTRELAELAGVSWQTAANANHRLQDAGLLELVVPGTPSLSQIWQVVSPLDTPSQSGDRVSSSETDITAQQEHDAFRRPGLGKTGADVFFALKARDEATVTELVDATGRSKATVHRKLAMMADLFMAEYLGHGRWRAFKVDLDAVARKLGTAGDGKKQRDRHRRDRRLQRLVLEQGRQRE